MTQAPRKTDSASAPAAPAAASAAPVQYRLVVRSAAEAVRLVQERFGPQARVLAVRQIEAGGLGRFLQKPRLEVIVEVGGNAPSLPAAPAGDSAAEQLLAASPAAFVRSGSEPRADSGIAPADNPSPRRSVSLLRASGLDETLIDRVRAETRDIDWDHTPLPEALAHLVAWLRKNYDRVPRRPAGPRRVYLGTCGVGKTTALCKAVALDVFVHGRKPAILKLDGEQPNATDGLAAFSDVLGAPLLRSAAEVEEFDRNSLLYVDVPGVGLDAHAEHKHLSGMLDALRVDTRILVVNAASETEVIADSFEMGRACGATHVVFTHLDEVRRPGKLWRFVLQSGMRPLFLSAGPSPAGEIEEDVFGALLARTFPRGLAQGAAHEGGRA
jgi:flagellar biosynthesis protein FlhF